MDLFEKKLNEAQRTVGLVYDTLKEPESVPLLSDAYGVYSSLAPHLKAYEEHYVGRQVAFVAAVGSLNYRCVTEDSDIDMKAVYLPSFEDLYFGRNQRFSLVTDKLDCELHPMQNYRKHALKGNINFFEPLFSLATCVNPKVYSVMDMLRTLVKMNVGDTVLATFFTAEQMNKRAMYGTPDEPINWKSASHAYRLLTFIIDLLDGEEMPLAATGFAAEVVLKIKRGEVDFELYNKSYEQLHACAKRMMFKSFEDGSNFKFSDAVLDHDLKGTPEWNDLNDQVDIDIMRLIKSEIY